MLARVDSGEVAEDLAGKERRRHSGENLLERLMQLRAIHGAGPQKAGAGHRGPAHREYTQGYSGDLNLRKFKGTGNTVSLNFHRCNSSNSNNTLLKSQRLLALLLLWIESCLFPEEK